MLEFACGYGRNVRHLVRRFPRATITVSDIDGGAVAFASGRFGVCGRLSASEPEALLWDDRYDLIVVPSLFSHLSDATFHQRPDVAHVRGAAFLDTGFCRCRCRGSARPGSSSSMHSRTASAPVSTRVTGQRAWRCGAAFAARAGKRAVS